MKQGWVKKKLVDACDLFTDGNWIESKDQSLEGIRLIQTGNVGNGEYKDKKGKERFVSQETFDRLKCTEIFPGDILVSRLPEPVGRSCIIPDTDSRLITAVDCTIVRTSEELLPVFLRYFQLSNAYLKDVNSKVTGTTRSRISRKNLGLIEIPIPPLEEQKQIVAKLDQCFEAIDKACANAAKNLENTKELFQSKLNDIFSQKGEGWVDKVLVDVTKIVNGYAFKSGDFSTSNGIKSIKITNVGVGKFVEEDGNYLPKEYSEKHQAVAISQGDIVLALTRTIISGGLKIAKVSKSYDGALLNQRVAGIKADESLILTSILQYFFQSKIVLDYVLSNVNTLMQPNLSIKDLKMMPISIPPRDEQNRISLALEDLQEQAQSLESKYQQELNSLEELKKSILQKAFEGELV